MASNEDIIFKFGADVGPLKKGTKEATTSLDKVGDAAKAGGAGLAKLGTAATAAGVAFLAFSKLVGDNVNELKNQAAVANTSIATFRNLAFAAKSVGVEQDTLADILKDVNDKIGDFVQTGAGPMVDFFEKIGPMVGVTADNFKDLSGDQALKLYVDSLNSANLSQADMVFYMEAIASDATKLLPLYADQSAELERLSAKYSDVNDQIALTANQADALGDMKESFDLLGATAGNAGNQIISTFAEPITDFLETTIGLLPSLTNNFIDFFNSFLDAKDINSISQIQTQLLDVGDEIAFQEERLLTARGRTKQSIEGIIEREKQRKAELQLQLDLLKEQNATRLEKPDSTTGTAAPVESDADYLAKRRDEEKQKLLDNQVEIVNIVDLQIKTLEDKEKEHLTEMARLNKEYVDGRLSSGEDFSKTDLERQQAFSDLTKKIAYDETQEKLNIYSQMAGNLSRLMSSSSKELFNIGKAAAMAQATIDGYSSVLSAYKAGNAVGGPIIGGLFAATAGISAAAMIANINSASFGGGGKKPTAPVASVPSIADTAAAAASQGSQSQQQASPQKNIAISLQGDTFSRDSVLSLINEFNGAIGDGAVLRVS